MKIGKLSSPMLLVSSAIGGIAITLATGLVNSTPYSLAGATWYGYPMSWLIRMVVAPQYNPWSFQPAGFAIDAVAWFVVVAIVLFAMKRMAGRKGK